MSELNKEESDALQIMLQQTGPMDWKDWKVLEHKEMATKPTDLPVLRMECATCDNWYREIGRKRNMGIAFTVYLKCPTCNQLMRQFWMPTKTPVHESGEEQFEWWQSENEYYLKQIIVGTFPIPDSHATLFQSSDEVTTNG